MVCAETLLPARFQPLRLLALSSAITFVSAPRTTVLSLALSTIPRSPETRRTRISSVLTTPLLRHLPSLLWHR
ncbi:hypothetical protein BKA66DRAFT_458956 [Pyrenochaeta sp. MPI-SDFR-AT-0127]|nr:hypothetical protein BKA66DRAFT_458956 [Pyrenochaeta sp. MPI-SDFR-AT-0127]